MIFPSDLKAGNVFVIPEVPIANEEAIMNTDDFSVRFLTRNQ